MVIESQLTRNLGKIYLVAQIFIERLANQKLDLEIL